MHRICLITFALVLSGAVHLRAQNKDEALATVAGHVISAQSVDAFWRTRDPVSFAQIEEHSYRERKRALDAIIAEYLLSAEAMKVGVTVQDLLKNEVFKRAVLVTEEDGRRAFERLRLGNRSTLEYEQVRGDILRRLNDESVANARAKYLEELWDRYGREAKVHLVSPRSVIDHGGDRDDRHKGVKDAPVKIIAFADFQCSYCKQLQRVLNDVIERYSQHVTFVWRDYPLPTHPNARDAAEAALCAHEQGSFWQFHDHLFESQAALRPSDLRAYARAIGLHVESFNECFESRKYRNRVERDASEAARLGVFGTPTIFINGRRIVGVGAYELYEKIIQEELKPNSWRFGP